MNKRTGRATGLAVSLAALLACLVGCGVDEPAAADTAGGSGGGGTGADLVTVPVTVASGAYVDAEQDGGDELTGVVFADPAMAVCTTGERTGVIPEQVDVERVEAWTNADERPVVFPFDEDVRGEVGDLPPCSVADDEDEMATDLLHGSHVHSGH